MALGFTIVVSRLRLAFGQGFLHVTRLKHGVPSVHPLGGQI
jgi:hypothetical protein